MNEAKGKIFLKKTAHNEYIIKYNLVSFFAPILLFFPMLLTSFLLLFSISSNLFVLFVPLPICLGIAFIGLVRLLNLFKWGRRKMVISPDGISFFTWKIKKVLWEEVVDLQLKQQLGHEYLVIQLENNQKYELLLSDTQMNSSATSIYEKVVEAWYQYHGWKN